jgi:methyl-accepting chemotaxis protein
VASFLGSLTIRSKIAGSFGFVLLIILGVSLMAVNRLSAVNDRAADIRDNSLPSTGVLGELLNAAQDARVKEARFVIAENDHDRQLEAEGVNELIRGVETLRAAYEHS